MFGSANNANKSNSESNPDEQILTGNGSAESRVRGEKLLKTAGLQIL